MVGFNRPLTPKESNPIMDFLNKPANEATLGDMLILDVTRSLIGMITQTWVRLLEKKPQKP